jgi:hypothetical protein
MQPLRDELTFFASKHWRRLLLLAALILADVVISEPVPALAQAMTANFYNGVILMEQDSGTANCNAVTTKGAIRYNSSSNALEFCNGTSWQSPSGTPAGSNGYVQFNNSGAFGADSNLFWDNTNKRLGIGTTSPSYPLDINGGPSTDLRLHGTYSPTLILDSTAGFSRASAIAYYGAGESTLWYLKNDIEDSNVQSFSIYDALQSNNRFYIGATCNVGIGTASPNTNLDVNGFIEWQGESRVTSTFSKTSSTTLAAITGLSAALVAGKTYAFDVELYTASNSSGGINVDLNGGTATATAIIGDAISHDAAAVKTQTRIAALNTSVCAVTAVTAANCHITGTITVNAAGTFIPEFAQNASNGTASTVAIGSTMILQQIN